MVDAGLILEGGGMRGIFTAGVLDFFMDQGLMFEKIYAVSAGACHACSYLSGQRGRALRSVVDYIDDRRYANIHILRTTGDFFGAQFIYEEIPNHLLPFDYETFKQSPASLFAVVTNCQNGEAEYKPVSDLKRDMILIRASSSLPLLSKMVPYDGKLYLDGGITDSIPMLQSVSDGNSKNVVILTQHRGYKKKPNNLLPLIKLKYRAYPALYERIKTRHIRYNRSLDDLCEQESAKKAFVIQPGNPVEIGRLEKNAAKLNALYRDGYEKAEACFQDLLDFLNS